MLAERKFSEDSSYRRFLKLSEHIGRGVNQTWLGQEYLADEVAQSTGSTPTEGVEHGPYSAFTTVTAYPLLGEWLKVKLKLRRRGDRKDLPRPRQLRVHRHGYTRRGGIHVSGSNFLIRDVGRRGRTPQSEQFATFRGHIDGYHTNMPEEQRHTSIRRAINEHGALRTFRQLLQLRNVEHRTNPRAARIAHEDYVWVRAHYKQQLHIARARER